VVKVAIYTRVSSQEQVEGNSLENQLSDLKRWADYKEYEPLFYSDEGKTGTNDNREGLQQLLADAKAKRFEIVAVTKLDRFFRKLRPLLNCINQLDELGIVFTSITEGFDTKTEQGRFSLHMMGVIAEFERNRIVERTREGRYASYRKGQWAAGQPLYGYYYDRDTKILRIKLDEANVVKRIFHLYVYDRIGVERIARYLNEHKVLPRGGDTRHKTRQWYAGAVRDLISHPAYKGEHPLKIIAPKIIEPKIWDLAQQRRKDNRKLYIRKGSPWLLQGITKCGLCRHSLACGWAHARRRIYSCRGRLKLSNIDDRNKCKLRPIDAEWLEKEVWNKISKSLSNPRSLEQALDDYINGLQIRKSELEMIIQPIEKQLKQNDEKKQVLYERFIRGRIDKNIFKKLCDELDAEDDRLSSLKADIDPAQVEELNNTISWLQFWTKSKRELLLRLSFIHEDATEEEVHRQTLEVAQVLLGMADIGDPSLKDEVGGATTKRQLLDYLQCNIIAYDDRVEVKAILPVENILHQEYNPSYR